MSEETTLRDLFDRWERIWHEGQYDLIPDYIGPNYIRHDRTVTREAYAAERRAPEQACRFTGSRLASSRRLGLCSNSQARHGPTPLRRSTGRARRQSSRTSRFSC